MKSFYILFGLASAVVLSTAVIFSQEHNNKVKPVFTPAAQEAAISTTAAATAAASAEVKIQETVDEIIEEEIVEEEVEPRMEIGNLLNEGNEHYQMGNLVKAINLIEDAAMVVRQYQSEELEELLPKEIEGWQVRKEGDIQNKRDKVTKGISVASREFVNDDKLIKVSFILNSPLLEDIFELASQDGGSKVGDYKGYIKTFTRTPNNNSLQIAVGHTGLVVIEGFAISHSLANGLADSVNLEAFLEYINS